MFITFFEVILLLGSSKYIDDNNILRVKNFVIFIYLYFNFIFKKKKNKYIFRSTNFFYKYIWPVSDLSLRLPWCTPKFNEIVLNFYLYYRIRWKNTEVGIWISSPYINVWW